MVCWLLVFYKLTPKPGIWNKLNITEIGLRGKCSTVREGASLAYVVSLIENDQSAMMLSFDS